MTSGPGELRDALEPLLRRAMPSLRLATLESRPMPYASSFALDEILVTFDDGSRVELVRKDTGHAAMLPDARRVKPKFLYSAMREAATYESILAPLGIDAPRCYGAAVDAPRGRYWLFLERVSGRPLTEVGDFDVWKEVCGCLARMHARLAAERAAARATASVPLVSYEAAHWRQWMERAERFLQDGAASRTRRTRFEWLRKRFESAIDEMALLPTGLVHGDFFASNVLVEAGPCGVRARPVDWELAGIGPVLMDLATLTAGRWSEDARTALAMSYHAALDPHGSTWLPREAFLRALDCCRLHGAVRQLGWAAAWTPPGTHVQDWLGDAIQAAERLRLAPLLRVTA